MSSTRTVNAFTRGNTFRIGFQPRERSNSGRTIPGAQQLAAGRALFHREQLPAPTEGAVIAFCQSGLRASVAANALRRAGHEVIEVDGSYAGWSRWQQENDAPARG